ncbi:MAG: zinc ribbon domain-containing protein [Saccharofermentanales bacterium]
MFCTKCGANMADGAQFCTQCGAQFPSEAAPDQTAGQTAGQPSSQAAAQQSSQAVQPAYQQPVQPVYQQPVQQAYQQPAYQQPVYHQPVYQQSVQAMPKKKRHVGLYIMLGILICITGAIAYILGSMSFFKPKNLGISYTQADFNSVVQKLGLHITADLGNGETYDNMPILTGDSTTKPDSTITDETLKNKLSYKDFNWEFSNYQPKSVTLTPAEVTAFFNEIAPSFWWFDKTQVKIAPDGKIITSSQADIEKILSDLYPDVAEFIPIPLPGSANLYTEGDFSITDNQITMDPEVLKLGPIGVPTQYLQGENLDSFSSYLDRFYTIIPDLQINSAGAKDGGFVFDGVIPTEVSITPKNP